MGVNPTAEVEVDEASGAHGTGLDYIVVSGVADDGPFNTPRLFSNITALTGEHGDKGKAVDFCSHYFQDVKKPVLFMRTAADAAGGNVGFNKNGVTGTSIPSLTGSALDAVDVRVRVKKGGIVGTSRIVLEYSLDGGRTYKVYKLGTATSFEIPFTGLTLAFSAGTLVALDVVTFWTTEPFYAIEDIQSQRAALRAQTKLARLWLVFGEIDDVDQADDLVTEIGAYHSENGRDMQMYSETRSRFHAAAMIDSPGRFRASGATLGFLEVGVSGDTITRSTGSWVADGFAVGDIITVAGSVSNNVTGAIAALSATVITLGTTDLVTEAAVSGCTVTGATGVTFVESGDDAIADTIVRGSGSWATDGFKAGMRVTVDGSVSNDGTYTIATVSTLTLTLALSDDLAAEASITGLTITAEESKTVHLTTLDDELDAMSGEHDDRRRLSLAFGHGRKRSPLNGFRIRRNAIWGDVLEYMQHDVHVAPWQVANGSTGWTLLDENENLEEYDEDVDGGACAAGFTCFKQYDGRQGAYIANSLTRGDAGSLLSKSENSCTVNLFCTVVKRATEDKLGAGLIKNADGTAQESELVRIEEYVRSQLEAEFLKSGPEGQRASGVTWTASRADLFNEPGAVMNGEGDINLLGKIEKVHTRVRVS